MIKADVTFDQQLHAPHGNICKAGHVASAETHWYKVTGNIDPKLHGVYCETCVKVAYTAGRAIRAKTKQREAQRESQRLTTDTERSVSNPNLDLDIKELLKESKLSM
jgi:hypothetical protein